MDCLIGIDFGTTNVKCVAYDAMGNVLAQSTALTPVTLEGESQASYEPDKVWGTVAGLIRETVSALPSGSRVAGVAVAGVGESVVPLDRDGNALSAALAWFDSRPREIASPYLNGEAVAVIPRITGTPSDHTLSAFKALYLKTAHSEIYNRVRTWLPMADYIAFRLSGKRAVSLSLASRTMLIDLVHRTWSEDLLRMLGLDISQWPELVAGGTRLGEVTSAAARETGLPQGAIVAAGGHDHLCGALAAGAIDPGVILDSMGTTEAVLAPLSHPLVDEKLSQAGFSAGCHAARDRYYVITGITGSGGLCAWLRRTMFAHVGEDGEAFRLLEEAAASSPPGANGVRIWPCFAGANPRCPGSMEKGVIEGLTIDTSAGDIARAALEALSAEFSHILNFLAARTGHSVTEIILTGGASANILWRTIKATMTGRSLVVPEVTEAGCLGAAMLAGIAAGIYVDERDALRQISTRKAKIIPQPEDQAFYKTFYDRYTQRI